MSTVAVTSCETLRFLFGFTGTTLTNGTVGGGCTRCDAFAIEAYLTSLVG